MSICANILELSIHKVVTLLGFQLKRPLVKLHGQNPKSPTLVKTVVELFTDDSYLQRVVVSLVGAAYADLYTARGSREWVQEVRTNLQTELWVSVSRAAYGVLTPKLPEEAHEGPVVLGQRALCYLAAAD